MKYAAGINTIETTSCISVAIAYEKPPRDPKAALMHMVKNTTLTSRHMNVKARFPAIYAHENTSRLGSTEKSRLGVAFKILLMLS